MSGPSLVKRIWNSVSAVIVLLAVVLAVLLVGTRVIGLRPFSVLSGSMEPEIMTGSLIYVKSVDPATLKVGDDITYVMKNETVSTHRIVEIIPEGYTLDQEGKVAAIDPASAATNPNSQKIKLRFRVKGVANATPDAEPVADLNVVGKVQFSIPFLGYIAGYIQNPPGTYVAISIGALLILLVFLPDLLFDDKPKTEDEAGSKNGKNGKKKKKGDESDADETADSDETDVKSDGAIAADNADGGSDKPDDTANGEPTENTEVDETADNPEDSDVKVKEPQDKTEE